MPVEFALRPRIRLREAPPRPQRSRLRLPRFVLPVAAYWLVAAGLTYAFVHAHDARLPLASDATDDAARAADPAPRENRPWWQRVPEAPAPEATPVNEAPAVAPARETEASIAAPAVPSAATKPPVPEPEAAPAPARRPEPAPASERIDSNAMSQALLAPPAPATRAPTLAPAEPPTSDDVPDAPVAPPARPPRSEARSAGLPSCEAAIESAHQDVDFSRGNGTADLPTAVIAAVLENGAWLSSCGVPANTSLDVCVAIRSGNVIGASVVSWPANAEVTACVRRRASSLQFPYSPHVDIARTRF